MSVLVDTSVWSLALRRHRSKLTTDEKNLTRELADLIRNDRVLMIGPIRQELLSGLRDEAQFERLRKRLADFPDEPLLTADFEEAARDYNVCRASGIAGSPIDILLCAVARRRGASVFTTDADFEQYAKHLPFHIHRLSSGGAPVDMDDSPTPGDNV